MMNELNAREKLLVIADWLGWLNEGLSFGLKSPEDAIKLYNYWQKHAETLPAMADQEYDNEGRWVFMFRKHALGYDPLGQDVEILTVLARENYEETRETSSCDFDGLRRHLRSMYIADAEWKLKKEYNLV